MSNDINNTELNRLLRERAALDEEASKIEAQAEIMARARSGPIYGPEGSRQSGYLFEKQKALAELSAPIEQKRALLDAKFAAAQENDTPKDQDKTIDMDALQKAAILLALGEKKEKTHEQGLTAEFRQQAARGPEFDR